MCDRFICFMLVSRWAAAILATMYHVRFLLFVNYDAVSDKDLLSKGFYFLTGLGHESYAVFFILDGILAGLLLRHRSGPASGRTVVARRVGSLYRIVLPSLLVGASLDLAGSQLFGATGVYTGFPTFSVLTLNFTALLGNLLMLQPFFVPNFGSNSMLYLASYLFWALILQFAFVRAAGLARSRAWLARGALGMAVAIIMPYQFLIWAAIWLAGVAVVFLGEAHDFRPSLLLALSLFCGVLVLSRLLGSGPDLQPEPLGDLIAQGGYCLVGLGFAALAWAVYPRQGRGLHVGLASSANRHVDGLGGQAASFTFFCHFPVVMLLAAMGATLFDGILMQQPVAATYLRFAGLVAACIVTAVIVTRASAAAASALAARQGSRA